MTAVFEYTQITYIPDSSLAEVVYYNEKNHTLAIQFVDGSRQYKPSVFYAAVPRDVYLAFVNADSIGRAYNMMIKHKFPNLSSGTIHGVTYRPVDGNMENAVADMQPLDGEKISNYEVTGYIRIKVTNVVEAFHAPEAAEKFAGALEAAGIKRDDVSIEGVILTSE